MEKSKGRVFVVQEALGRNIMRARRYGTLAPLLPPGHQVVLSPGPMVYRLRKELCSYTSDDYLLLMGDPIAIGTAVAIAAQANQGRVNCLKWDKQEEDYYPVHLDLFDLDRKEERYGS